MTLCSIGRNSAAAWKTLGADRPEATATAVAGSRAVTVPTTIQSRQLWSRCPPDVSRWHHGDQDTR